MPVSNTQRFGSLSLCRASAAPAKAAARPNQPAPAVKHLSRLELALLDESVFMIGPLTCRQWDAHLRKYFNDRWQKSLSIRHHFPGGFISFMAAEKKPMGHSNSAADKAIASLSLQLMGQFAEKVSRLTRIPFEQLNFASLVFWELKQLAVRIDLCQAAGEKEKIAALVKQTNAFLARAAAHFPVKLVIA
jgi:hypothetical protein